MAFNPWERNERWDMACGVAVAVAVAVASWR